MKRGFWVLVLLGVFFLGVPSSAVAKEVQAGFIYVTPIGDAGWSYAHDVGR